MGKYSLREIDNKGIWENFVLSQNPGSFLQSWNWGETNKLIGNKVFRLGFYKENILSGVALVIEERARRGAYFLIPGGPLLDWKNSGLVKVFIKSLVSLSKKERVWFVRVRPEIPNTERVKNFFRKLGFADAPIHLHAENTWVLDITDTKEKLFSNMRKGTRYLIRKSQEMNLTLESTTDPKKASILYDLQRETAERHGFVPFPRRLFEAQLETFGKDNQARIFLVSLGGKVLSAAIILFYGDSAYYHHSASTSLYPKVPANYFLQWEVIKEAKRLGFKKYNFWGIAPTDSPRHRFSGVTLFKKGFGGQRIDWLHAQDLPIENLYWATHLFETMRRIWRRL